MNTVTQFDPFRVLNRYSNFLPDAQSDRRESELKEWAPAVDIAEDEEAFTITADLPDVKKEDVSVSVLNGCLTITGQRARTNEEDDKSKKYHRIERSYGAYSRSFALPDNVDTDAVKAKFEHGVLNVHIPKISAEEGEDKVEVTIE